MARNVEIKARTVDLRRAGEIAAAITGGGPREVLIQVDTYFNVPVGRLKLREFAGEGSASQLIFYARTDEPRPRKCDYHILQVDESAGLKDMLARALGVRAVVRKERAVYLFRNVRIHLDAVEGLGSFLEFEAVLNEEHTENEGMVLVGELMQKFSIAEEDILSPSYCELIESRGDISLYNP